MAVSPSVGKTKTKRKPLLGERDKRRVDMNTWSKTLTERITDGIRVTIWCVLAINVFLTACFSVWFVGEFLWSLGKLCSRTIFREAW
jgi:hypothetical protein